MATQVAINNQRSDGDGSNPPVSAMDRIISRRYFNRRRILNIAALLIVSATATAAYIHYARAGTLSVSHERIQIATVSVGSFAEFVPLTGTITARNSMYLDAVDGGQIAQVWVEEGAQVHAGQTLVKLNNTQKLLEVMRVEAELTAQLNQLSTIKLQFAQSSLQHDRDLIDTQAQVEQLERQQTRRLQLGSSGAVSRADIEDGASQLSRMKAMLAALTKAQALDNELQRSQIVRIEHAVNSQSENLAVARKSLESLIVTAPIDGQLTSLNAHAGESKAPGQRIGQIDQLSNTKVVAMVDEFYLARITAGQHATVDLDNHSHHMRVTKVYPEVRDRQFKLDLEFVDQPPASIRTGQTLQLRLEIGAATTALMVENGPYYDNSAQGVFVISASGNYAQRRHVMLGRRNTDSIEVLAGLAVNERIVTSDYKYYNDIDRLNFY
jgi:HlyD family secretion protein